MTFQIQPLSKGQFDPLFDLSDAELTKQNSFRVRADTVPGFPCRVSLKDANVGDELILLNFKHLEGDTPYAASHAIYVSKDAAQAQPAPGEIPDVLTRRLLSVRGFDAQKHIAVADIVEGTDLKAKLEEMFDDPQVDFVDVHFAQRGCFGAKAVRV